jgi:hypothetical protein
MPRHIASLIFCERVNGMMGMQGMSCHGGGNVSCHGGRVFSRAPWPDLSISITLTVIKLIELIQFTLKNYVNPIHTKDVV